MRVLTRGYKAALGACLRFPAPVYGVALTGLVAMVVAYTAVGKSFMPTMDEGSVIMQVTKLPSINLDASICRRPSDPEASDGKGSGDRDESSPASDQTNWASIRWD